MFRNMFSLNHACVLKTSRMFNYFFVSRNSREVRDLCHSWQWDEARAIRIVIILDPRR